jgi:xylulokinase
MAKPARGASRELFVGLDIGTSGVKACAVDRAGLVVARASHPLRLSAPRPGWAEQDPADWWTAALHVLKQVTAAVRAPGGDGDGARGASIEAIGLSGQMHTSVFLDRAGAVIRPALLWCDGRTTLQCREIEQKVSPDELRAWVSNPALEGFTLPKILWLRKTEPAAFRRLAKVLLPKDYIRLCLTGVMASEPSDAAGTLLFDVSKLRWSAEMARALDLSPELMPPVGGSAEILGRVTDAVARRTGLRAGTPVVGGGADNACGAIGVGAVSPGTVVASWGTSGTVLAPTAQPVVDPGMRAHTFCHAIPDTWYVMGVMLSAGAAFAWFQRELARELASQPKTTTRPRAASKGARVQPRDPFDLLTAEAASISPGAEGVTFLPYLQGERTPHRDAGARGAFVGLSLAHTRAHLARAVLEGICFGLRDCQAIIEELGLDISRLLFTGGGARSPFVRQLEADISGKTVIGVEQEEGPAFGAALLGAVGVGAFPGVAAAVAKTTRPGQPTRARAAAHRAYEAPYRRFRALYPALKAADHSPPAERGSADD